MKSLVLFLALAVAAFAADTTPPTISSATISTNGVTLTIVFDETVSVGAGGNAGFKLHPSGAGGGAITPQYVSGSGSNTLVYTLDYTPGSSSIETRTILDDEDVLLSYDQPGNGVEDSAGNDLPKHSGTFHRTAGLPIRGRVVVVNNSTQT